MELTLEQSEALRKQPDEILDLVDPATQRHYALLSREALDRIREEADDARHAQAWQSATLEGMRLAVEDQS